jgi:hypothetical protein
MWHVRMYDSVGVIEHFGRMAGCAANIIEYALRVDLVGKSVTS